MSNGLDTAKVGDEVAMFGFYRTRFKKITKVTPTRIFVGSKVFEKRHHQTNKCDVGGLTTDPAEIAHLKAKINRDAFERYFKRFGFPFTHEGIRDMRALAARAETILNEGKTVDR